MGSLDPATGVLFCRGGIVLLLAMMIDLERCLLRLPGVGMPALPELSSLVTEAEVL